MVFFMGLYCDLMDYEWDIPPVPNDEDLMVIYPGFMGVLWCFNGILRWFNGI